MKYVLDPQALRRAAAKQGFRSLGALASQTGLHRNTLGGLLRGQGVFARSVQQIANTLQCDPLTLIIPASTTAASLPLVDELRPMLGALTRQDPDLAVILFGSRARGTSRTYSDWDLGLTRWPTPLDHATFVRYKFQIEDLTDNVVRMIDVVNLDQAPHWFLAQIATSARLLDGNATSWAHLQGVFHGIGKTGKAPLGAAAP